MPQLDPTIFVPQIAWLFISFILLYLLLSLKGLPKVGEILANRKERIDSDLDAAEQMREQSVELEAQYEKALAEAKSEAAKGLQDARDALNAKLDTKKEKLEAELGAKVADAEATIEKARSEAMAALEEIATGACQDIVSKLGGLDVDEAAARKAVKAEIAAIQN